MSQSIVGTLAAIFAILAAGPPVLQAGEYPPEWPQLDASGLAELAQNLESQGSAASAERELLASYVADLYSTKPPVGQHGWRKWLPLIQVVGGDLPAGPKSAMTEGIKRTLLPDEDAVQQLGCDLLVDVGLTLTSLGRADLAALYNKDWMDARSSLDDVPPSGLAGMARCLAGAGGYAKDARLRIASLIGAKYLTGASGIYSVSCSEWEGLATSVKDDLSPDDRLMWRTKLRSAFGSREMPCEDLAIIHWVLQMLGDTEVNSFVAGWVESQDAWHGWGAAELVDLGALLGWGYRVGDEMIRARQTVADRVLPMYLGDPGSITSVSCEHWQMLAKCYGGELIDETRTDWAKKLRSAYIEERLSGSDLALLVDALKSLGDVEAIDFVESWLDEAGQRLGWSASDYMDVARRARSELDSEDSVMERLAERLAMEHLAEGDKTKLVRPGEWKLVASAYGDVLSAVTRAEWASKIYASYEDDRYALSDEAFENLDTSLTRLDATEMGLLLSADRKCHEALSVSWDGSLAESPAWQDAAWQRLCWSVIASDPARRSAVWQRGIRQLPSDGALPSGRILAAADQLIACLGKSEADVPSPDQVLGDLLRLSRDYEVRGGLVRRIEQRQLQAGIESLSSDLKKMARRGLGLADEGKTAEAVASYTALLGRDDLPAGEGAAAILRAELLGLLLKQEPVDLESAGKQLQALVPAGGSMPARVWNLAFRLLLNRVLQTPRAGRQAVWSEGVKLLSGGTNHISADTFSGLDSLLASLQAESDSMAHRILADLMLLSPDLASMVRLQQRRVAVFASESNWQEAKTAAVLCAAMANATTGGPVGCVSRCADIMRFAGAPVAELEGFRAIWAGKNPKAGSTATLMIDSVLTDGAKAALEAAAEEPPPRRLAYLHLFAGQAREALRHAHVALTQAKDEHEILDRLDDIQTILSAIGCGLGDSDSFSRWLVSASVKGASPTTEPDKRSGSPLSYLAEFELGSGGAEGSIEPRQADGAGRAYPQMSRSERAGMAGKHLTRRRKRLVRWGAGALRDKEEAWARNCLAVAINMPQGPDDATLAIDAAVASAVCTEGVKDVGKFLETVLPLVHSVAARRHLLYRLAVAYYNQGLYEESIKCLDSSATLAEGLAESQHMAAGILRARLLIELARYEDAAGVLAGMQGWQGAPEQRARVLFLTGWTCLQTGDNADALSAFQQVVDRFGKTGVAEEAARMAGALKKGT